MPRVYLDACCLNRPWDDQTQQRIRLESEAVLLILARMEEDAECIWVGSNVLEFELSRIPDPERRKRVHSILQGVELRASLDESVRERAEELQALGFKAIDALHIGCAENNDCDVLLTTDDRMIRTATRNAANLRVRVENPVDWLKEARD